MKLLFVHDTKLKEDNCGNLYTGGSYNNEVWKRYLSISSKVTVVSRKEQYIYDREYAINNFNNFNQSKMNFIEIPDTNLSLASYLRVKGHREKNTIIKKAVLNNDYIIARIPSNSGNIAIHYAEKFNKPYLVEVVGCPWDSLWNYGIKGKIISLFAWANMKIKVSKASYVSYVTTEFLQRRYPSKGNSIGCSDVVLPNVDIKVLENRLQKIKDRNDIKPIVIGTTGAINVRYKGQEYVIKAISRLKEEGYDFEYHLAGGGDNSYLKSIAEKYGVIDKVKFLGSLPHDKVFSFLDSIDIYIQPSKTEGLPRALVEAMSRGCPSLGSKTGGIPELLNEKVVFSKGSVEEIISILKKFDKKIMIQEAQRSFEKAKKFNKKLLDNKRTTFYKKFIGTGGNFID